MQNNIANVGFGYSMKDKNKHPLSIHEIFTEWIQNDGKLRERFKNAVPISKMQGGLIPYNTNDFSSAGNRYIITGDAASLIDPISGGGIGSAMYSGYCAAKTALQCVETQDFSYTQTKTYEKALKQRIQKEIRKRNRLQKLIRRLPFMLDMFAYVAKNQKRLQKISSWYFR
jgi:flavin-dependent dehydrogenase